MVSTALRYFSESPLPMQRASIEAAAALMSSGNSRNTKRTLPVSIYFDRNIGNTFWPKAAQCGQLIDEYSVRVIGAFADPIATSGGDRGLRDGCTRKSRRRESEEDGEGDAVTNVQRLLRTGERWRAVISANSTGFANQRPPDLTAIGVDRELSAIQSMRRRYRPKPIWDLRTSIKMTRTAVFTTSDGGAVLGENG